MNLHTSRLVYLHKIRRIRKHISARGFFSRALVFIVKFTRQKWLNYNDSLKYNLRRIMAKEYVCSERYSCNHNQISGRTALDGVSARGTIRLAPIYHIFLVPEKHGANHTFSWKNMHCLRYHVVSAVCRRRRNGYFDWVSAKTSWPVGKAKRGTTVR